MPTIRGRYTPSIFQRGDVEEASAQGVMIFWDDTLKKWVPTATTELIWDDTNKALDLGADPSVYADGTQIIKFDDTNKNMFIGTEAFIGFSEEGEENIALGYRAGYYNKTTGNALWGDRNVFIGYQAGHGISAGSEGYENIGIGVNALYGIDWGVRNVAIGYRSVENTTTGSYNFGLGTFALLDNTTGDFNVGIGYVAGYRNETGDNNISIGYLAGSGTNNQSHNRDTFIGTSAGKVVGTSAADNVGIGYESGFALTSGANNTFIGSESGRSHTTGGDNIYIGYKAGYNQTTNSNLLIIDNQDRGSAAAEITDSLIYGVFNATITSQTLQFNATTSTTNQAETLGAGATTFAVKSNVMTITGDGGGNTIATITGANSGTILTLIFVDANVTITDDNTHGADSVDLSGAFTSADDTVLQLAYDGTSWYEVSRSTN